MQQQTTSPQQVVYPEPGQVYPIYVDAKKFNQQENMHIKYDFKPASIDPCVLGNIVTVREKDVLRLATTSAEDQDVEFIGKVDKPKSTECLLIWNPEEKCFRLEKLSHFAVMRYSGKLQGQRRLRDENREKETKREEKKEKVEKTRSPSPVHSDDVDQFSSEFESD
jgi:hypothetical protein